MRETRFFQSPFGVLSEQNHMSLMIGYEDGNIATSFDLDETIHERMESSSVFYLEIVRKKEKGMFFAYIHTLLL